MTTIAAQLPRHPERAGAAVALLCAAAIMAGTLNRAAPGTTDAAPQLETAILEAPLAFEPNAGRTDERVDFLARSVAGGDLYLTGRGAVLRLPQGEHGARTLRMDFTGTTGAAAAVHGIDRLAGEVNSFIGDDPRRWRTGIPTYGRVRHESVYPGIDVDFYGNQQDLEYDFRVAPGADASRIGVELSGADSMRLTRDGMLTIDVGGATVNQRPPVAYQEFDGRRQAVDAGYELDGSTLRFGLGDYDRSLPLVIDPVVLGYSTYLGGGSLDRGGGIAVDAAGAAYVSGTTESTDFPTQDQFQGDPGDSSEDIYVAKLNPDAGGALTLAYATYIGGGDDDAAQSIAVDSAGAAYVTGDTDSTNFPTQDPFLTDPGDTDTDAVAVKLNPDGGGAVTLAYSTYLGGDDTDFAHGITVDSAGAAYVAGTTESTDFPTQEQFQTNTDTGDGFGQDAFVTKLNPDGGGAVTLAYSTYLGGGGADSSREIEVDSAGAAYLVGGTDSANFPTQDPFQTDQPSSDGFVTKLNPDGGGATPVTLAYSTYLGGGVVDGGSALEVDTAGAAYVVGSTTSADFPTQDPFQTDQTGFDAYVAKLNPDAGAAVTLAYSTYIGGNSGDFGNGIGIDPSGAAYIAGATGSSNLPIVEAFSGDPEPGFDAFATKLNADGGGATPVSLGYLTYLGGNANDDVFEVAVDSTGVAYVQGDTLSSNFPTQDPFQTDQGGQDAYVTRLIPPTTGGGGGGGGGGGAGGGDTTAPDTTITNGPKKKTKKKKATFEFTSTEPGSSFECQLDKGAFEACTSPRKVKVKKGKHTFSVRATDAAGNTDLSPAKRSWKVKKKKKKRK